jgi:glycerate kinase
VDALVGVTNGKFCYAEVQGSLGEPVHAKYGIIHGDTAVIEMAAVNGLTLIPEEKRDLLRANSYGTGQLIRKVLKDGYRKLIIAVGGSATNDGGMGAMVELGAEFLDRDGNVLAPSGGNLQAIADYRIEGLCGEIAQADISVMCDVDNPLLGPNGATCVYGPQKGGTEETLAVLERGMRNYADVILKKSGIALHDMPGAGAAGGISAALVAFAGAKLRSGISVVLEASRFEENLKDADLVITGEGRLDGQSVHGKVVYGVGTICRKYGVPVIALTGGMTPDAEAIYDCGVSSVMVTVNGVMGLEQAIGHAEELLEDAADRMFRMIKIGETL